MHRRSPIRVRRAMTLVGAACLVVMGMLVSPLCCLAVAHDVPGTNLGPSGTGGTVDGVTNPRDVYAVQLYAGQAVTFKVTPTGASSFPPNDFDLQSGLNDVPGWSAIATSLYAPNIGTIQGQEQLVVVGSSDFPTEMDLTYLPAVTGVYYLEVSARGNGIGYYVAVAGSESAPVGAGTYEFSRRVHNVPGRLMGPAGVSGVSDFTTNPTDVYAVQLFAGQKVTFNVTYSGKWDPQTLLFAPGIGYLPDAPGATDNDPMGFDGVPNAVAGGGYGGAYDYSPSFSYTPAVTGVYYLAVSTQYSWTANGYAHGVGYHVAVSGSEGAPDSSTVWDAMVAPGFSAYPTLGQEVWLSAFLMPAFNTNAALLSSTVTLQESTDTVRWSTAQTLAGDGIFDVGVRPSAERWYRFAYNGDDGYAASTSALIHITPRVRTTSRIRSSASSVKAKRTFKLSGSVSPAVSRGRCRVWVKRPGHGWARLANVTTNRGGAFSIKVSYRTQGTYRFYASFDGNHTMAPSSSGAVKVRVR